MLASVSKIYWCFLWLADHEKVLQKKLGWISRVIHSLSVHFRLSSEDVFFCFFCFFVFFSWETFLDFFLDTNLFFFLNTIFHVYFLVIFSQEGKGFFFPSERRGRLHFCKISCFSYQQGDRIQLTVAPKLHLFTLALALSTQLLMLG